MKSNGIDAKYHKQIWIAVLLCKQWLRDNPEPALVQELEKLESENARLSKRLETSVSKMELDTCRALNEALRQREDRMRKAMRNAGFVWRDDEFKDIEK